MTGIVRRIARDLLNSSMAEKLYDSLDIVGDIAIIRKPFNVDDIEVFRRLAEGLIDRLKYIRSVWLATSPVEGSYRVRKNLVHLAGEKRTETLYREHGCVFKVDISKVYISPRLSFEHLRIAKLVKSGEVVINMFAGVGLFSIIIAKYSNPRRVISIDINPDAYRYMKENINLNKVNNIVEPVLGDALMVIELYRDTANRILIPLPELAQQSLYRSIDAVKGEGFIHVYEFTNAYTKRDAINNMVNLYSKLLDNDNRIFDYRINNARIVRSVGPRRYQVVLDIWIRRS